MQANNTRYYYALLGVGEDASQEELETHYSDLAEYLSSSAIPARLKGWARQQAELVDEAYAILADREIGEEREDDAEARRQPRNVDRRQRRQPEPAQSRRQQSAGEPPHEKKARREREQRESSPSAVSTGPALLRSQPLVLGIFIGIALVGAVLVGRYAFGGDASGDGGAPEQQAEAGAAIPLDTERVAELMAVVEENPSDAAALFELGESFFQANEWEAAITWFTKLLEVDPENVHAITDIGTSHFELGRLAQAKEAWLSALNLAPEDVQVHYNLGFLYANSEPPDFAAAKLEWERVVQLEPNSELAQTAQVHLDSLEGQTAPGDEAQVTPAPN